MHMRLITPAFRVLGLLIVISAALVVACGGSSGSTPRATSETLFPPASTSSPATTAATPASGLSNEGGQAPVFYRTADNFASATVGQPYKVVFRITNGYAADRLTVVANCRSCFGNPPPQTFQGVKVQPVGEEATGSFYPVNLLLPVDGQWELTVQATPDDVTIPVDVKA